MALQGQRTDSCAGARGGNPICVQSMFLSRCGDSVGVLCFARLVEYTRADGTIGRRVRPYIIDLGSGNGTFLNNQRIEPQRYYELKEKDVLKFGFSSREYVLLHESSDKSEANTKDDDEEEEEKEEESDS